MTDFFAISNADLEGREWVEAGQLVKCQTCGQVHPLEGGTDMNTGQATALLLFYSCGEAACLAAVQGRLLPGVELADEKGAPPDA